MRSAYMQDILLFALIFFGDSPSTSQVYGLCQLLHVTESCPFTHRRRFLRIQGHDCRGNFRPLCNASGSQARACVVARAHTRHLSTFVPSGHYSTPSASSIAATDPRFVALSASSSIASAIQCARIPVANSPRTVRPAPSKILEHLSEMKLLLTARMSFPPACCSWLPRQ